MPVYLLALLLPPLVIALYALLAMRIRLFRELSEGRYPYVIGGVLVLLVAIWNAMASSSSYSTWFVVTAYSWISFGEMLVLMLGLGLSVFGLSLHARRQQVRQEEIDLREGKLSILENLQHDARGPYQLLELLNLTLRETLLQFPESCGAVFLVNRSQRVLVLGAISGFTKSETAHLEHFPLGNNLVSRAIEVGEPALTSAIDLHDKDGKRIESRFQSGLVLPLCSGMEKIGAILLAAEQPKAFTPVDIRYLGPISEWLAEKIRTARLTREVAGLKGDLEANAARSAATLSRFTSLARAVSSDEAVAGFCQGLVGLIGSSSVQLFGLRNGAILQLGGSEPVGQLSESFRTALIDAIDRRKPVVINHESTDSSGQTAISRSSLVFPIPGRSSVDALMLVRESGPISVTEDELKLLSSFALLAGAALDQQDGKSRDLTRRLGIDKVLELLAAKPVSAGDSVSLAFV
jgi:GAF domain-containing protein